MSVKKIPESFLHVCNGCGLEKSTKTMSRPKHWSAFNLIRDAYDFHDNACADASVHLSFCSECSDAVAELINDWASKQ